MEDVHHRGTEFTEKHRWDFTAERQRRMFNAKMQRSKDAKQKELSAISIQRSASDYRIPVSGRTRLSSCYQP
jgi:hypothetical protein